MVEAGALERANCDKGIRVRLSLIPTHNRRNLHPKVRGLLSVTKEELDEALAREKAEKTAKVWRKAEPAGG